MENKFFCVDIRNKNKQKQTISQLVFSNYQCQIVNNILQVELTQRFQSQNSFSSFNQQKVQWPEKIQIEREINYSEKDSQLENNSSNDSNEAIYYLPINQYICLESFEAKINGKTAKGIVKKINESQALYSEGKKKGDIVGHCEKKTFEQGIGECLEIKLGNIPENFCMDIKLKFSQQLKVILNTFYQVDLLLILKESNEQINQSSFILDLTCSQKITFFKNFGMSTIQQHVDENHVVFMTKQKDRSQTEIYQTNNQSIEQFRLIYQFEEMHLPQVLYGACESQVNLMKDDKSNKQIEVENKSFMISFVPDFNFKFKTQINDEIAQSLSENQNIFSEVYLNSLSQKIIDQTDSSKSEFIFLLDRSGSMAGSNISNAIEALVLFIKSLPSDSYFNIYSFGTNFKKLFKESQKYSNESVETAITQIQQFKADLGGTDIYKPLQKVYQQNFVKGYGRQIYILTDGQVDNKEKVIKLIQSNNSSNRVHAIGIGSSVDTDLVQQSAKSGLGYHTFADKENLIQESVIYILQNSISPILEDVKLSYNKQIFNQQYPLEDQLYCVFKDSLFTFTLFLKAGLDIDNLSEEDKQVKIQYYDTSINQNVERIVILTPQDAHKYDSNLIKTVFKLGIHQKLSYLSNFLQTNQDNSENKEKKIQDVVNESIEHQILTSYTSYFCEIQQITDDNRIQYFEEKVEDQDAYLKYTNSPCSNQYSPCLNRSRSNSRSRSRDRDNTNSRKRCISTKMLKDNKKRNSIKRSRSRSPHKLSNDDKNIKPHMIHNQQYLDLRIQERYSHKLRDFAEYSFENQIEQLKSLTSEQSIQQKLQFASKSPCNSTYINKMKTSWSPKNNSSNVSLSLQNIINQVSYQGIWVFNQEVITSFTKCTNQQLENALNEIQQKELFMTMLMVWILENKFFLQKQQWQLIVNKSNKYIQQQISDPKQIQKIKQIVIDFCKASSF